MTNWLSKVMKSPSSPFTLQEPSTPRWCACHVEPVLESELLCAGYRTDSSCFLRGGGLGRLQILAGGLRTRLWRSFPLVWRQLSHLHLPQNPKTWNTNIRADLGQFPEETEGPQGSHRQRSWGPAYIIPLLLSLSIPFLSFFFQGCYINAHYQEKSCFLLTTHVF